MLNDTDADGDLLTIAGNTLPSDGVLVNNGSGSYSYTPNPGFAGEDSFTYDVSDGTTTVTTTVRVSVNATFDAELARDQILLGVASLVNPTQPGHMIVYGPTAISVSNYPGGNLDDPMIAAATLGAGRVIAVPDHQWLNLDTYGSDPSMSAFYKNSIAWLADSSSLALNIVTYDDAGHATWLTSQGYTNVTNATDATLSTQLATADVFVAAWLGSTVPAVVLQTIADYTRAGGGLFIADYGVGYDWWWGQATEDIPGNRLLRPAGIGFTKDWPHGSSAQPINRASGQLSFEDIVAVVNQPGAATQADRDLVTDSLGKLDSVLAPDDILQVSLDAAILGHTSAITPTPATPVSDSFSKALLGWESNYWRSRPVAETVAHRAAFDVGPTAPRVSAVRTISAPDGHATINIPTGLYAAPGDIVTVTVPAGFQTKGLRARISHLRTDLGDTNYYHMPFQQLHFDLDSSSVDIASPYGGLIAIEAESGEDGITGGVFGFSNVVEAPYYVHGITTDVEWTAGIRDRQTPFGVLVTDKSIHVIESEAHLRMLSDPTRVMQIWEDMIRYIEEFYSYTTYRPLRVHHDYQPAGGFSTFPQSYNVTSVLLDYKSLVNYGYGLTHHEYGHIVDPSQMHIDNFSEAAPNFGGMYTSRFFSPFTYRPRGAKERIRRYATSQTVSLWSTAPHSYHHEKITPFICLADTFGWDKLINVVAELKQTSPANNQEKLDNWLTLYGSEIGHDISPFFALWQLTPTASALAAVSALPEWNMVETIEEALIVHQDTAVSFPSPADNDFSYDGSLILTGVTNPSHGTISNLGAAGYSYTPDPGFTGADSFTYTVVNATGNSFTTTVPVTVLAISNSPKLHLGTTTASTDAWTLVHLPFTYAAPVVVTQHVQTPGMPAMVSRIRNVEATSFELLLQRPDGSPTPVVGVTVNYYVAEEGVYTQADHGIKMEAVTRLSTVTDTNSSHPGEEFELQWNTLDHYALPVILGQVMSTNDNRWSTWWSDANSLRVIGGKHVGTDAITSRADEVIGYIAMETGTVQFNQHYLRFGNTQAELGNTFGSGGNTISFPREPQITAAIVQGTGLTGSENSYWSVLNDSNNYAGNVVGMELRNNAGLSTPSDPAGYIVAARISQDCNGNSIPDETDIVLGTSEDCNLNGIPDSCELASGSATDCDQNGVPDNCDITSGTVPDVNMNGVPDPCEGQQFQRGDANSDGTINIADPVATLAFLFSMQPSSCALSLDANDDNSVDIADPVFSLSYLFQSGSPAPAPPFLTCGQDPTPGGVLTCDSFPLCP